MGRKFVDDSQAGASLLAAVICYEPDLGQLTAGLSALRVEGLDVLVIDNGSQAQERIRKIAESLKCRWVANSDNRGIATAINQALAVATDLEVPWLWTFDQDTEILQGAARAMRLVLSDPKVVGRAALVGMRFIDRQTGADYGQPSSSHDESVHEVDSVITTGCATRVAAVVGVGGADERLFIDGVDHDLAIRCRLAGWRILRAPGSVARHSLGHLRRHRLLGITLHSTNHSALRRYFMARNTLRIVAAHGLREPRLCLRLVAVLAATVVTVALFEACKGRKLRALFEGVRSFCLNEYGPAPSRVVSRLAGAAQAANPADGA
ncbi:glycosyltransferase [Ramlibacter sp. AW1]|uniref:Glycosyltransferase n=1 Tax=Ramlibacter aurantiacus TaxID=2801330 RepID=A0A937D5D2_9BURK|nr:glycosyltransferase [Ramlibacter aurantiacus]MBL0421207.1 glycosyltransferase [Ramlibacter aurantiacus]